MTLLPIEYYQNPDVLFLSRDLIGKFLMTSVDGQLTGGIIVETEAYRGPEDKASHAFGNRRTKRNEIDLLHNSNGPDSCSFSAGCKIIFRAILT